jgi:hypothetical protein
MTRLISTGVAMACAAAVALHAQDRPAPAAGSTVSVIGCVQQADADGSIAGTPLGTSVPPEQAGPTANRNLPWQGYVLADARPASAARDADAPAPNAQAAAPTGTTGTTGTTRSSDQPASYALDATVEELDKYKGQRVEVTGTVSEPEPSAAGNSGSRDAFRTGVKRLKVASIKTVAANCDK